MNDQTDKLNKKTIVNLEELLKKDAPYIVEDGKVNLDKLKGLLTGKTTEKEDDRFYFNWAGKDKVFQAIQAPAYSTLAPQKDKSIGWDETENLMIVGENLETLKLLLKPYFSKVKVIYIDPPYNTGKDFIYKDDFSSPLKDYLERTGQKGTDGTKLTTNSETNGRYHSDWLNFMCPRLFMARNLLKDDGVILISIDDNEVQHLRMIMDDIYGEDNFIAQIVVQLNPRGRTLDKFLAKTYEYILVYAKDALSNCLYPIAKSEKALKEYNKHDDKGDYRELELRNRNPVFNRGNRPKLYYPLYINLTSTEVSLEKNDTYFEEALPLNSKNEDGCWTWGKKKVSENLSMLVGKKVSTGVWRVYRKDYADPSGATTKEKALWLDKEINNENGKEEMNKLFGTPVFDFPKSVDLVKKVLRISTKSNNNDIFLDFFAGSGTSGQALFELNMEDEGNRKAVLVQIDELVDEKQETGRNATKLGLKTVADICVERLKRVSESNGKKLKYKVFKLSPSNFNLKEEFELAENKDLGEIKTNYLKELGLYVDQPTVATANTLDIVYEIILKNGFSLNSKIEELKLGSNNFYKVNDTENELEIHISLDAKIEDGSVEAIRTTEYKGKTFAFYDNALTDSQKINLNTFVKLQVI